MSEVIDARINDTATPAPAIQPRPLRGPLLWVSPEIVRALYEQRVPDRAGPVWTGPTGGANVGLYTARQIMSWVQPTRAEMSPALEASGTPYWRAGFNSGWNACCAALSAAIAVPEASGPAVQSSEGTTPGVMKEGAGRHTLPEGWSLDIDASDGHVKLTSPGGRTRVFSEGHGDVVVSAFIAALAGAHRPA
jgi:hypothetical protein